MWEKNGLIKRYIKNPILKAVKEHPWESELVYNAAVIKLEGKFYMMYRAMGTDHIARFGMATSTDGITFHRFPYPVFFPSENYEVPHSSNLNNTRERGGVEDPRFILINDTIYIIYTAFHKMCHLAMAKITVKSFIDLIEESEKNKEKNLSNTWNNSWVRLGLIFPELFEFPELFSRNSIIFQLKKDLFALFYRIHKGNLLISLSGSPEGPWKNKEVQFFTKKLPWESERIGISTPAIGIMDNKTKKHIIFYHGVEEKKEKGIKIYHLGAFIISTHIEDDTIILKTERLENPVLSPERKYELENDWLLSIGVFAVFSCGAVPVNDDEIFIYYGAGDSNINVGKLSVSDLLHQEKITEYCKIERHIF